MVGLGTWRGQPTSIQQEGQGLLATAPALQQHWRKLRDPQGDREGPEGSGGRAGSRAHGPKGPQTLPPTHTHTHCSACPAGGGPPSDSVLGGVAPLGL